MKTCPVCNQPIILPSRGNNILYLASMPSDMELQMKRQNAGELGQLLRREFYLDGRDVDPLEFTRAFMLWHGPSKNAECLSASLDTLFDTQANLLGKIRHVLLVGSTVVEYFTGYKVSDVNGLDVTNVFSAWEAFPKLKSVTAMVNPNIVFAKGVGELRFAISNFVSTVLREEKTDVVMKELGF